VGIALPGRAIGLSRPWYNAGVRQRLALLAAAATALLLLAAAILFALARSLAQARP
jgi:hypothetical protein